VNKILIVTNLVSMSSPLELDYRQVKVICLDLFNEKNDDPLWYVYKFGKRCEGLSVCDVSNHIIKAKLFHHSL
jgi:hypothetical protein